VSAVSEKRCAKTREIRASRFSIEILDPRERKFSLFQFIFSQTQNLRKKEREREREREREKKKDGGKTRIRVPFRDGLMSSTVSSFLFLFDDDMFLFRFCVSFRFCFCLSPKSSLKKTLNPKP